MKQIILHFTNGLVTIVQQELALNMPGVIIKEKSNNQLIISLPKEQLGLLKNLRTVQYVTDISDQIIFSQELFERKYRSITNQSSLNPTIAAAMGILSEIDPTDQLLDPCCGTGTILIERRFLGKVTAKGVDIDPRQIKAAISNIPKNFQSSIQLKHADIKSLNFPENYFSKIVSNLPYGVHSGSRQDNIALYRFLADNAYRWLKPEGKAVFLTHAKAILRNSFASSNHWILIEEIPLQVGGLTPTIFVYQKARK